MAYKTRLLIVIVFGLLAGGAGGCIAFPEKTAKFDSFSVTPTHFCTNKDIPIARLKWKIQGNEESRVHIALNDVQYLAPKALTGTGNWSGEENINLRDFFQTQFNGANIPSRVRLRATITGAAIGAVDEQDSREQTLTTDNNCP
jgi:hypothetical protein